MNDLHALLPLAMGMLLSPLPIVAVVAILLAPRGRASAPAYTTAFTLASLAVIALGALTSAQASASADSPETHLVSLVIAVAMTLGFAVFAVVSWRSRPAPGTPAAPPKWLAAIDGVTPLSAAGLGLLMAVANSKNIPLALKGGALIGEAHLALPVAVGLCIALAIAGSLLLIVPALLELTGSRRVRTGLARLKADLVAHNAAIMTALFALLAANEAAHVIHRLAG